MARRGPPNPWLRIGFDAWRLGVEASAVIGLRTLKIAAGGAAGDAEARRMVSEKLAAAAELQTKALAGGLGLTSAAMASRTLSHYRRKVRANRRRLSKA
jgi:hypothetical protein